VICFDYRTTLGSDKEWVNWSCSGTKLQQYQCLVPEMCVLNKVSVEVCNCYVSLIQDEELLPDLPAEVMERIITRPEDLPEQVTSNIQKYKKNILRLLEVSIGQLSLI